MRGGHKNLSSKLLISQRKHQKCRHHHDKYNFRTPIPTINMPSQNHEEQKQLPALPHPTTHITTTSPSGLATVHSSQPFIWQPFDHNMMAFAVPYTTSTFPPDLTSSKDLSTHNSVMEKGNLGLVNPGGTVIRCVDFAPGYACMMHKTKSLDYGIVLEGEIEMVLDSGERRMMGRGDVAVWYPLLFLELCM
jgi:hypothetical protein